MKRYLVSACLLCFISASYAQQVDQKVFYQERLEKFKRIKKWGTGLTAFGGIALIVGVTLTAADNKNDPNPSPYSNQKDDDISAGEITTIGSFFLLGPGIPLWIVGGQGESKYQKKVRALSLKPSLNQKGIAVALALKF